MAHFPLYLEAPHTQLLTYLWFEIGKKQFVSRPVYVLQPWACHNVFSWFIRAKLMIQSLAQFILRVSPPVPLTSNSSSS